MVKLQKSRLIGWKKKEYSNSANQVVFTSTTTWRENTEANLEGRILISGNKKVQQLEIAMLWANYIGPA